MTKKLTTVLIAAFTMGATITQATVISFEDFTDAEVGISPYTESEFTLTMTSESTGMIGFGADYDTSYWSGNGTGRMLTYSNNGSESGFTMTTTTDDTFSLGYFEMANGYVSNSDPVSSIDLTGTLSTGGTISTNFVGMTSTMQTFSLSSEWTDLVSVEFTANGTYNKAMWDTISTEAIPEPATLSLFAVFGGIIMFIRRRKFM